MMSRHFIYFFRLIIFWFSFFTIYRFLFFVFYYRHFKESSTGDNLLTFIAGYKLDFSTICYFIAIPFILWLIQQFVDQFLVRRINLYYHCVLIIIVSLIFTINLKLYNEWGTIFNYRGLSYAIYPKEVMASLKTISIIHVIIVFASFSIAGILAVKKILKFDLSENKLSVIVTALLMPAIITIGIRGGVQLIPVNESSAYFSQKIVNNHLAVNHVWYLANNVLENTGSEQNLYLFFPADKAHEETSKLYESKKDKTANVLKISRPNIVLIILESYSADFMGSLRGMTGVAPTLDSISKEGILFTDIYSSGFRTEQGIISLLSGFPSVPNHSVIRTPEKVEKLPLLGVELEKSGYHNSFYYGGEVSFGNINMYLKSSGFKNIIEKKDYQENELNSKWGAHDEFIFQKQLLNQNKKQPFFDVILTLSNHEPFEVPVASKFKGEDERERFKNSAWYTDKCIGDYLAKARTKDWYSNTLFVFVADHGHTLAGGRDVHDPLSRKIPLLLFGPALKKEYKGVQISKTGNHHDLPALLLKQLKMDHRKFRWSKDLLNPESKDFAFIANESGFSWVTPEQDIVYFLATGEASVSSASNQKELDQTLLQQAKSYIQVLYSEFIGL